MYSYEQRKKAVELYIQYGKYASTVIRELGYPNRHSLLLWYKEFEKNNKSHRVQHTHFLRSDTYECSSCGYEYERSFPKCPHCGAVMGKTKYEPSWVDEAARMDAFFDD